MSIYSRRGDTGETRLADGSKSSKASARIEACGAVDEAASLVAFARRATEHRLLTDLLDFASQRLATCAAVLSNPGAPSGVTPSIAEEDIATLEGAIDRFEQHTGSLKGFVALTGSEAATRLHVARAVVRRAERRAVALHENEPVPAPVLGYLNRLSDSLFAAARFANYVDGMPEELWDPDAPRPLF